MAARLLLCLQLAACVLPASSDGQSYDGMKIRQMKSLLQQRGVACDGCVEKEEFLQRLRDTEDMQPVASRRKRSSGDGLLLVSYCMS